MVRIASAGAFTALLAAGLVIGSATQAAATEVRPLEPRFERRAPGDISILRSDSETATATRPAGSRLLFAGLYWGATGPSTNAPAAQVTVRVGSGPSTVVAAAQLDADPVLGYGAVAEVTNLFAAAGPSVDLTVSDSADADWSLVTAWTSPSEPLRDLRVLDGLSSATGAEPGTATVSGLSTPVRGEVDASADVVAHGGDAQARAAIEAGDTEAAIPVWPGRAGGSLVAAVTTATEAAAVTDLRLATVVSPATATVGDMVTVTVTVSNDGPDDQTGPATLTLATPAGLTPDAVTLAATAGACGFTTERVVCAVDPMPAGSEAAVTFAAWVDGDAPGVLHPRARALASTADIDPMAANDTHVAKLTVSQPETAAGEAPHRHPILPSVS
ncbi:MAG: hypothetical protein ACRDWI_01195 [Jiangellaceae bacterium]